MRIDRGPRQALVGDEELAGLDGLAVQQRHGDLPFTQLGAGQPPGDRAAVGGGEHLQPKAPEVAAVAGAVAVVGVATQRRTLDRLAAGGTGDGGGVQQPEAVVDAWGLARQVRQDRAEQPAGLPQPLVGAGLVGQLGNRWPSRQ
jgi:hypothetical protein